MIEATLPHAAAYKPNIAFFEALGKEGWQALLDVVRLIPPEVPVLLDAKRGDISTTAEAYAMACLQGTGATGVTLHGYMGVDSVAPFMKDPRAGAFVLCKTSNPSSADFQTLECTNGKQLYEEVARKAGEWGAQFQDRIGLVVGATDVEALRKVRALVPEMWILAPGIGAQGGDLDAACAAGMSASGGKLLLPISRGISSAASPAMAAEHFRFAINTARKIKATTAANKAAAESAGGLKGYQSEFIRFAIDSQVLLLGSFTLKSGRVSPYFFNAGKFTSGLALKKLAAFYAQTIVDSQLEFDVLFGPAYKGITLASAVAVALAELTGRDVPFAYNRKEAKDHGEGGVLVGADMKDKKVVIVDDVITAGTAIRQSMDLLASVGAQVVGVALALDRQEKGTDSPLSAVQSVEQEFGLKVLSVVGLDHLLAFLEGGTMGQESLEAIRGYRTEYGITLSV